MNAIVHVTITDNRAHLAEHHYCRKHAEEFFAVRRLETHFWPAKICVPSGRVEFDLSLVAYDEEKRVSAFYLHERGGTREFPITSGMFEFLEADRLLRGATYPRPSTHDMATYIISRLGGELRFAFIIRVNQEQKVFYAGLGIRVGGEAIGIDARPSDAIIMALHTGAPILVSDDVLNVLFPA